MAINKLPFQILLVDADSNVAAVLYLTEDLGVEDRGDIETPAARQACAEEIMDWLKRVLPPEV